MKKISKSVLKEIVKECLVEILSEGLSSTSSHSAVRHRSQEPQPSLKESYNQERKSDAVSGASRSAPSLSQMSRRPALDSISYDRDSGNNESRGVAKNETFERNISSAVSSITDDPIMGSIFSDTARTTLQEQISDNGSSQASINGGGDAAARKSLNSDPMSLFGDASSNWAALAFSDKKRPGT